MGVPAGGGGLSYEVLTKSVVPHLENLCNVESETTSNASGTNTSAGSDEDYKRVELDWCVQNTFYSPRTHFIVTQHILLLHACRARSYVRECGRSRSSVETFCWDCLMSPMPMLCTNGVCVCVCVRVRACACACVCAACCAYTHMNDQ